jgi:release factor glutamine methyltransferase
VIDEPPADEFAGRLAAAGVDADDAAAIREFCGDDRAALDQLLARRLAGEPLALIVGRTRFMGVELAVNPGVLAPRSETALLGGLAVTLASSITPAAGAVRIVDMCCGAGNLACAVAVAVPGAVVYAADVSDAATALTTTNAVKLGVSDRVHVAAGDLFDAFVGSGIDGTIDLVICNPPYISTGRLERDRAALLAYEPRSAFDAGPFGITIQQRVINASVRVTRPGGWVALEVGAGQHRQVSMLFARAGRYATAKTVADASGTPRVVYAQVVTAGGS